MNLKHWLLPAVTVLCLSACSATKARISDNQALYDTYSPQDQAAIKSNRIDQGFDPTQVYLSLGKADRTESEEGRETWYYHATHSTSVKEEKSAGEYRDDLIAWEKAVAQGRTVAEPGTHRILHLRRTRVERMVHFENGSVVSWEEPDEMWLDDWH